MALAAGRRDAFYRQFPGSEARIPATFLGRYFRQYLSAPNAAIQERFATLGLESIPEAEMEAVRVQQERRARLDKKREQWRKDVKAVEKAECWSPVPGTPGSAVPMTWDEALFAADGPVPVNPSRAVAVKTPVSAVARLALAEVKGEDQRARPFASPARPVPPRPGEA